MQDLSDEQMNELAIKVAARLERTSITRLIPKDIQSAYAKANHGYPLMQMYLMPVGNVAVIIDFVLAPDGSMNLTLSDTNHQHFWSAHLTSEI